MFLDGKACRSFMYDLEKSHCDMYTVGATDNGPFDSIDRIISNADATAVGWTRNLFCEPQPSTTSTTSTVITVPTIATTASTSSSTTTLPETLQVAVPERVIATANIALEINVRYPVFEPSAYAGCNFFPTPA
jgi:hypothetical protein